MRIPLVASSASLAMLLALCTSVGASADDGPALSCGVRLAPRRLAGAASASVTCWVTGAPVADTAFSVQIFKLDGDGTAQPLDAAAADGTLSDGAGTCTVMVSDPAGGPLIAGLIVAGTFEPSGTPIGPMTISPTIAGR